MGAVTFFGALMRRLLASYRSIRAMMKRLLLTALVAFLFAAKAWSEELVIPGSGPPETVTRLLAEAFNAARSAHRVTVPKSTGTAGAIRAIEQNETVLARTLDRQDLDVLEKRGMHFIPFGRDAVVFIVGARVLVRSLSTQQIVDIFGGVLTDWRELGHPPGAIRVVYRERTEASLQMIRQHLEPFRTLVFTTDGKQVYRDFKVLDMLDRFGTGIGFGARSNLPSAKTMLRATALDGVEPTPENVAAGRYKLVHRFGFLHKRTALTAGAQAFLAFVYSNEGRAIIERAGVVPLERKQ
jgi:phosphate transport system substrate-binding protein